MFWPRVWTISWWHFSFELQLSKFFREKKSFKPFQKINHYIVCAKIVAEMFAPMDYRSIASAIFIFKHEKIETVLLVRTSLSASELSTFWLAVVFLWSLWVEWSLIVFCCLLYEFDKYGIVASTLFEMCFSLLFITEKYVYTFVVKLKMKNNYVLYKTN